MHHVGILYGQFREYVCTLLNSLDYLKIEIILKFKTLNLKIPTVNSVVVWCMCWCFIDYSIEKAR